MPKDTQTLCQMLLSFVGRCTVKCNLRRNRTEKFKTDTLSRGKVLVISFIHSEVVDPNNWFPLDHSHHTSWPRRIFQPSKASYKLFPLVPLHLLALFCLNHHGLNAFILGLLLLTDPPKAWMVLEMFHHPLMEVLNVRDGVDDATRLHSKRIFRVQCQGYNACLVLASLEVWIRKTEEDLRQLSSLEEVREEFHGVGTQTGYVLIQAAVGVLIPQGFDPILDEFGDLGSYLHAFTLWSVRMDCSDHTSGAYQLRVHPVIWEPRQPTSPRIRNQYRQP